MASPFESFLAGFSATQARSARLADERYQQRALAQRIQEARDVADYRKASLEQDASQFNSREARESAADVAAAARDERMHAERMDAFRRQSEERIADNEASNISPEDFAGWRNVIRGGQPTEGLRAIPSGPLSTLLQTEAFRNSQRTGTGTGTGAKNVNPYAGVDDRGVLQEIQRGLVATRNRLTGIQGQQLGPGVTASDQIGAAKNLPEILQQLAQVEQRLTQLGPSGPVPATVRPSFGGVGGPIGAAVAPAAAAAEPPAMPSIRPVASHGEYAPPEDRHTDPAKREAVLNAYRQLLERGVDELSILERLQENVASDSISNDLAYEVYNMLYPQR